MESRQKFCRHCNANVLAHKPESKIGCFAHMFHAFLTVMTGFWWGIVWIAHACYGDGEFRCSRCGGVCK